MESIKARFFGREAIIQDLVQGVLAPNQPLDYSLVGPKMIGKSRLLRHLASSDGPLKSPALAHQRPARFHDEQNVIVSHFNCDWPAAIKHITRFISEQLRHQLERERINIKWPSIERNTSPGQQIEQIVQQLEQQDLRLVLLLDNFDRVLLSDSVTLDVINELRPLTLLLGLIVASEQPLHDLNSDLAASPLFNIMHQHFVGLLAPDASRQWLEVYAQRVPLTDPVKDELLRLTGGHPFLLARLNDIISELQPFVVRDDPISIVHLPLIHLRLAEHGRPLFENIWRRLNSGSGQAAAPLLNLITTGPIAVTDIANDQMSSLNWLINQAIVKLEDSYYNIFSPLFTKFLTEHLASRNLIPVKASVHRDLFASLAPKEAELLRYLQAHSNTPVSFGQLLQDVWGQPPDTSIRRVQEAVRRLRNHLKEHTPAPGEIKSERGVGYRYIPNQ
jgi:hypothetical protein